ncbi:hypothetical protein [Candidatus Poriferisodalis sp.]|uniref:hypothetical protein n=1 Tax=Candidatus Poriferisodalis sp. TaxID=3101277 RepID=UPI003B02E741
MKKTDTNVHSSTETKSPIHNIGSVAHVPGSSTVAALSPPVAIHTAAHVTTQMTATAASVKAGKAMRNLSRFRTP